MKFLLFLSTLLALGCQDPQPSVSRVLPQPQAPAAPVVKVKKHPEYRVVHVFVALCDNEFQGIVPVPAKIGNGKDPGNNLYWGCAFGTRTFFKKHPDWKLTQTIPHPKNKVLERCVFRHRSAKVLLVTDAYDGEFIKDCTIDYLRSCAGNLNDHFIEGQDSIACGGSADLLAYVGHNGLMDFQLEEKFTKSGEQHRDAIILACASQPYFAPYLRQAGAQPLLLTTGLMAPEAYTLAAALEQWIKKAGKAAVREAAAQAYHRYQKCGIKGARNLFATG